ncbi:MAG TPA: tRNA 2-thiouridine(34) synthase MnmA [Candidatus Saccharimonadales bacterium]|nr:tRNA 2-thiouridine(34) synthase MnmA [Candidatus Saccharimonadales bacterium]
MAKKVYVGMSGGVDSSVTAALLKQQGYDVTGVYMKNWSQDLPGLVCPWKEDYQDAKRVAVELGIPFKMYDFEKEYRHKVVDYMVEGYKAGITPNPDVMCNQEVKFKLFLDTALEDGADLIATGHYSITKNGKLYMAKDKNKDQSYFLYRVSEDALKHSLMPVGELTKPEVRELAKKLGLATADKKDSQGICFVGKVGIKDFLLHELGSQPPGLIIDQHGREVGEHDGALFYTIGQRHGLSVGGGLPYYVVGKDMAKNEVYVTTDLQDERLWNKDLQLTSLHWINELPKAKQTYQVRTRYRGPLVNCTLSIRGHKAIVDLAEELRAITPGQSAVIYEGDRVLGGGIVS